MNHTNCLFKTPTSIQLNAFLLVNDHHNIFIIITYIST